MSGILIQRDENLDPEVISYASGSLSKVERRYSQTEHEALAIIWGCERFHLYLYGAPFVIHSDHKPQYLFNNPLSKPPARTERWQLRLAPYDFTVRYRPGKDNPADYVSRHPLDNHSVRSSNAAEEYVNFIAEHAAPVALSLQEIEEATLNDKVLQEVIKCMASDNWQNAKVSLELKVFLMFVMSSEDYDVLLRGCRIIIPYVLRHKAIQLAHEGHQGVVKTKSLLRSKFGTLGLTETLKS